MRVLEQEGRPLILRTADVDQDGRDEIIAVNSRYSRLDLYHWLAKDEREERGSFDPEHPNDLPSTNEIRPEEIQLEHLPQDVLVTNLGDDCRPHLVVLVSPPNRILVYRHDAKEGWQQQYSVDLLEGEIPARRQPMLLRKTKAGADEILVGFSEGIQRVEPRPAGRARWLTPREKRDRVDWWLADLDGDGDEDLVELSRGSAQAVRWYSCSSQGDLITPQVLLDRSVDGAVVIGADAGADIVSLDGSVQDLVRRYRVHAGEASRFGQQQSLPLIGGKNSVWCGLQQGADRVLVVADPNRPRLLSYGSGPEGWGAERDYPTISNIQAVAAVAARPGTLLIWTKDAADLQISRWDSQRLTFPQRWPRSADTEDRRILALSQIGATTWWVQKVGSHLDLYCWRPDDAEATVTRFRDVGGKADQVRWIGGQRLLVKQTHARGLRFVTLQDEKTVASSPSHLERAALAEFKLLSINDDYRLGRFINGVLQILGEDLQPHDQIMLPEGLELADYVAENDAQGWGLQTTAPFIHRFEADASGIPQVVDRIKIPGGNALVKDHYLGLLLVNYDRIVRITDGARWELKLQDIVDERIGRRGGVRETRINRIGKTDVDGDNREDLILFDDRDHRLSVLASVDGQLAPLIAWPVFDDKLYPYGNGSGGAVQEPRSVRGLDFDGDEHRDLAMLCHDRLVIYLGREQP